MIRRFTILCLLALPLQGCGFVAMIAVGAAALTAGSYIGEHQGKDEPSHP